MIRASTTFIAFLVTASFLATPALCGRDEKARLLADLSANPARVIAGRTKSQTKDLYELTLDLIVYRWAAKSAANVPVDVRKIDEIINASSSGLPDKLLNWAGGQFSITAALHTPPPPAGDPRVKQLQDLKIQFSTWATDYRGSPKQATTALKSVVDLCQALQLDLTDALSDWLLGNQYYKDMALYQQAEECYVDAEPTFSAYGCDQSTAMLCDDYGDLCTDMARYSLANAKYSASALSWVQLQKRYGGTAYYYEMAGREYISAGQAALQCGDEPANAMTLMDKGLKELRNQANPTKSYDTLITEQLMVADCFYKQGNCGKAIDLCEEASRECKYEEDPVLSAKVSQTLAFYYSGSNSKIQAASAMATARKTLEDGAIAGKIAIANPTRAKALLTAERGAASLRELKRYPEAEDLFQKILAIYQKSGTVEQQIKCRRSLAAVMELANKPQDANAQRLEAAKLANSSNKKALAAEIVMDMFNAFSQMHDIENELETLTELDSIVQQSGNQRNRADIICERGSLLLDNGRYDDAITNLQQALDMYSTQIGDPWHAAEASVMLATALDRVGKNADAQSALESAVQAVEARYAEENIPPSADQTRSRVLMRLYAQLIPKYVQAGQNDKACELINSAGDFSWSQELVSTLKKTQSQVVVDFVTNQACIGGGSQPRTPSKAVLLADKWSDFLSQSMALRKQDPVRYDALPIDPAVDIYKRRGDLSDGAIIVEYLICNQATYAFVCSGNKSRIWQLGVPASEIADLANDLRKQINTCQGKLNSGHPLPPMTDWKEPTFVSMREPLMALYAKLLAPIAADLSPSAILMFTLPDQLAGIPMHALISSEKDSVPRFLVQDYRIGYLGPGMLSDLLDKSPPIDSGADRLAVFADPAGDLPGARQEAKALENLFTESGGQPPYVGARANVANFEREFGKAEIIHIACHYKIDPSKFVMQLAADGATNGEITVQQLTDRPSPHLKLVVLSACESAASADPLKIGASSAAEVFSLAGAKSVMGGLWKVTDEPAAQLMAHFYSTLAKTSARAESLQRAQKAMIEDKQYAHPFYWACFALYGDPW